MMVQIFFEISHPQTGEQKKVCNVYSIAVVSSFNASKMCGLDMLFSFQKCV